MRNFISVVLFVISALVSGAGKATTTNLLEFAWEYKDLADRQGFLTNTSRDGFFKVSGLDLTRDNACFLAMEIEFSEPILRPALFEFFWATKPNAFAEQRKARFLINHKTSGEPSLYLIPLCKLYGFSGNLDMPLRQTNISSVRLDYPMNRTVGLKFHQATLLSSDVGEALLNEKASEIVLIEPYERVIASSFRSLDVILPKLYFSFEDGARRLGADIGFLLFWLSLILTLIGIIIWRTVTKVNVR